MIRQDFCPKCQQVTSQKTTKTLQASVTKCEQCSTTLKLEYTPRNRLQAVSPKQSKRNRELAKIEPPENGLCENCGEKADWRGLAKHHLVYKSQGGKDNRENLLWCCAKCHNEFHHIIEQAK